VVCITPHSSAGSDSCSAEWSAVSNGNPHPSSFPRPTHGRPLDSSRSHPAARQPPATGWTSTCAQSLSCDAAGVEAHGGAGVHVGLLPASAWRARRQGLLQGTRPHHARGFGSEEASADAEWRRRRSCWASNVTQTTQRSRRRFASACGGLGSGNPPQLKMLPDVWRSARQCSFMHDGRRCY
jgi:hypothetical protein